MKKISLAILTLLVALTACKKDPEVNLKYVDVERDLITVGTTTATVQCDYQYIATLKKAYLYYGEGENEADMNTAEMRVVQNTLYVDLAGLKGNTTYSYFYEFYNGFNSMRTAEKTFKTDGGSGPTVILPTVVTAAVTEITTNSAKGGGEVTNDGGAEVTERGICWSTNENPTLNDNHVAAGTGIGAFTAMMDGLEANTTYHVRAYAINEQGTSYGLDREFVTVGGGGNGAPEGAINGLFSINENGDQVYFSQGNLQYQASTDTWRFAEHQWDYVGGYEPTSIEYGNVYYQGVKCDNIMTSSSYDGWIDLYCWGTSGYNHGAVYYQPWSTILDNEGYYAYGVIGNGLYDESGQADWGYNIISNGGNQENMWRTLTMDEWLYLVYHRNTPSQARFAKCVVNNVKGLAILPDEWDTTVYNLNYNDETDEYGDIISVDDWNSILGIAGAVFLPASGHRQDTVYSLGGYNFEGPSGHSCGQYWSSSSYSHGTARYFCFQDDFVSQNGGAECNCFARSVRLVQDAR